MEGTGAKAVKRHNAQYDLFNRLHSIATDQAFVQKVGQEWFENRFEVVPNQRCGTWYCPPSTSYAYFKSTDGHTNNWNFNLRRANLSLAKYAEEQRGLILVDSTRRGKRMPDALSKTVPIWCAVINRAVASVHPDDPTFSGAEWQDLFLPAGIVSPSEREQIVGLLPTWTESLTSSTITLPDLKRPLRPFFIHHSTTQPPHMPSESGYTPIICLSASRWVGITGQQDSIPSVTRVGRRNVGFDYIPGAGDDDELWAKGLTPSTFWEKRESLLKMERDALERGLDEAVASAALATKMAKLDVQGGSSSAVDSEPWADLVGVPNPTSHLALALEPPVVPVKPWQTPPPEDLITIYVVEITKGQSYPDIIYPVPTSKDTKPTSLVLAIPSPKTDSWGYKTCLVRLIADLRGIVSDVIRIVIKGGSTANLDAVIADKAASDQKASVQDRLDALPTPTDVPTRKVILPIALLLLCSFPRLHPPPPQRLEGEDEDETDKEDEEEEVIMTKSQISSVLLSLVALWPDGNPPRAALKRVNEVLMSKS